MRRMRQASAVVAWVALLATSAAARDPASSAPPAGDPSATATKASAGGTAARIDINSASRAQLKTLPGIHDAEARKIVAGRPWLTKADLVTKGVVPEGTYVAIKNRIVAANPGGPAAKR